MKVIFLNIFEGCQEEGRFEKIISFVKREDPDILGLSELYNWDENNSAKLNTFLKQTLLNFRVLYKSANNFHVGIFSKYRFNHATEISGGIGMAKAKVNIALATASFSVIVAHLSAIDEDTRLKEFDLISRHVQKEESTIFMGDFNSLSPLDKYDDDKIFTSMKQAGIDKFGREKLRKEVIQKIMDAGFIDTIKEFSKTFEYSVPTMYCKDKNHFADLRLDYLFITRPLVGSLKSARIIRTNETSQLSDHFPLLAEFAI